MTQKVVITCTAFTKERLIFLFYPRLHLFSKLNLSFFFRPKDKNMLYKNQTQPSYASSMLVNLMEDISIEGGDVCELGMVSKNISYSSSTKCTISFLHFLLLINPQ